MKIHEYQTKEIFAKAGIPIPKQFMIERVEDLPKAFEALQIENYVVKAQIHAGGRGKAGGVKITKSKQECEDAVKEMMGKVLVTHQTGPAGKKVSKILITDPVAIKKEYYLAVTLDRRAGKGVIIASAEGGVEIEEVAKTHPEKILKKLFDPSLGLSGYEAREVAYFLGQDKEFVKQVVVMVQKLVKIFCELDASLVEINPLIETDGNKIIALDGKMDFDDNALYRHPDLEKLRDPLEEDSRESEAKEFGLSYVGMDGNVGCMVNGAGLAMGTMDAIQLAGGMPANFLDVGGGATVDQVKAAFELILRDPAVKAILVNIFGGIVKCDVIAEGILQAASQIEIKIPLVVRLEGTNVELGREKLAKSGVQIITAETLKEAAEKVVEVAK